MEGGGAATNNSLAMKRKATDSDIEDKEEDVFPVAVIPGSKHGDGSIYRPEAHYLHRAYHLADTRETRLEPMRRTHATRDCYPQCKQHLGCNMLQIFSLKLNLPAETSVGGTIQLYGFMAARDALDPLRNYVFNRSRDDPFIIQDIHSDPLIYLSGPKRGIYYQSYVLIEYDMRIKRGGREQDDLPLIDGVFACCDLVSSISSPFTYRINGDYGASVDISRGHFVEAVEATVEARVMELTMLDGEIMDLCVSGFFKRIAGEVKLYHGVIDKPCQLGRFVIAVDLTTPLFLSFKVLGASYRAGCFAFLTRKHGSCCYSRKFRFATIEVKVTWSTLE